VRAQDYVILVSLEPCIHVRISCDAANSAFLPPLSLLLRFPAMHVRFVPSTDAAEFSHDPLSPFCIHDPEDFGSNASNAGPFLGRYWQMIVLGHRPDENRPAQRR